MQVAGVVAVTVALWATAVVPEYFTAMLFFFFAVTLTGLTPKVVFSGFHSTAAWMVFGGLIIGVAVQSTGLGARLARVLLDRFGRSYLGLLFGTVAVAALAAFVLPTNTGRVLVLVPIFMSLADRLGFDEGSNGRTALALAVGAGTLYPGLAILPSAIPNLVLMSAAESIYGIAPTYGRYFLLHFPVIGLVSIIALPLILRALFPDIPRHQASIAKPGTMNLDERKLVLLLFAALTLWTTDFAHGISPAWIALGAGLLCLVPRIGVLPPSAIVDKINLAPWFFIAGVVSMSAAVSANGLGDLVGHQLFGMVKLEPGQDAFNFAAVSAMGMVIGLITTVPGEPAIMSALAGNIAAATGWPLDTALMAQVISWTMAPFPYVLPPLVIAAQLAGARASHLLRLLLAMTALAWLVMLPLQYLWWRALDMFA